VVAKADVAAPADVVRVAAAAYAANPRAQIIRAGSPIVLEHQATVRGKRVLAIEDGPTVTHGGMPYGAAFVAAERAHAARIVDPRPWAAPDIAAVYARHPHIGTVLPAMGYTPAQLEALRATIDAAEADIVVAGTPIDLAALIKVNKPVLRARYDFAELELPGLWGAVEHRLENLLRGKP
jgi:predicted GTPase